MKEIQVGSNPKLWPKETNEVREVENKYWCACSALSSCSFQCEQVETCLQHVTVYRSVTKFVS